MSKYTAFIVALTEEQQADISATTHSVGPGEAVIAQVYFDGMRVKLLTAKQVTAIQDAMGVDWSEEHNSAIGAHLHALRSIQ